MTGAADGVDVVFDDLLRQLDWLLPQDDKGEPVREREHADVVADLLGYLAERMTDLHERRQTEVHSFLEWLGTQLDCPIDELSGKTKVPRYYEPDVGLDGLLEVIEKNRPSKTSLDVSEPEEYGETNPDRERIVRGWERSMERLRPVLRQLELTDELIDRIVYRLYGLTPEEAALVERTAGGE